MSPNLLPVVSQPISASSGGGLRLLLTRAVVSMVFLLATWVPAHAVMTFDDSVTPDTIFGSGNSNGLFTIDRSAGVELGIRGKIPFTGVTHSNGDGTYSYTLAELLAANPSQRWNFDWTVNTDWDASSGLVVDDLTYLLELDYDPGPGTNFLAFDPITQLVVSNPPPLDGVDCYDHSIGTNATANGAGAEASCPADAVGYAALIAANNVAQQSWRYAFFPFHSSLTYDPTIPGVYDVVLSAFDAGNNLLASTSIQVIVDGAINTSNLSENGWFSDDTRADGTGAEAIGTNLISDTLTDDPEATVSGTPTHDGDIRGQISFGTPAGTVPAGTHALATHLTIASTGSGKSQITHRKDDGVGHGPGSAIGPGFSAIYSWMGDGTASVTASLKFGIKTADFGSTGVSLRTGENVWDKVLIYEPGNLNGGTSNGIWKTETVSHTSGKWWFFDRTAGASIIGSPMTLADMGGALGAATLVGGGPKTAKDVYDLITAVGAHITSVQFGIGSGNADGSVYVNQLETSAYRVGMLTTFGGCGDRYVDDGAGTDTGNNCLLVGAPCATIQHAVDEACDGETVNVAAGTYTEQVLIKAKNLSLVGADEATTTIEAPVKASRVDEVADHGFGSRTYDYQVGVFGTGTETVNISGFTLDGMFDAKISGPAPFRSQQLTFFNASGTVEANTLIDWQDSGAFGVQGVATLVVGSLTAQTVTVRDNAISGYQKGGIVAFGSGAVTVAIEDNVVTGAGPITTTAQNGIQISNGAGGSIIGNESTGANYTPASVCSTGILVFAVDGVTIRNNLLIGSLCDLLAITNASAIEGNQIPAALAFPFSIIGNDNTVDMNVVSGASDFGVYNDGTGNTYTCNRISGNAGGFFFDTFSGLGTPNVVNTNSILGNGVGVDASSLDPNDPAIDATGNWWGCATGPGGGGCDTVTANVDASLPAGAPPACVSCASDADCDDTLTCNGTETCNLATNVCLPGTPVVCSDQCETGVCEEPGGTCELQADGFVCSATPDTCTLDDTCQLGVCTDGGGGDGDSDSVCDADDNCPVDANSGQEDTDTDGLGDVCDLDDGPSMNLSKVTIKRQRKPSKPNGGVRVKGDFISDPDTVLTTSPSITLTVTDEGGFISQYTWDFASECSVNSRGKVKCQDPDRRFKAKFIPFRQTPTVFKLRVTFKKQAISDATVFVGDVTVRLSFGPPPPVFGSIDRVDTIDCEATGRGYKCRE